MGIEQSPPVSHFVTYAGLLEMGPKETMDGLRASLDFKNPPEVVLYAIEPRR